MITRKLLYCVLAAVVASPVALGQAGEKKPDEKKVEEKKDDKKPEDKKADDKKADAAKAPEAAATDSKGGAGPVIEFKTSEGVVKIELDEKAAPISAKNFLAYVNDKHYDGTIFHRVIDGFVIQGGGFVVEGDKLVEKKTKDPIANEAKNGLKNDRGTLSMARTSDPNSATSQFFVNLVSNERLNYPNPDGHGYAVFGKVVEGMDVIDKIAKVKTGFRGGMADVPLTDVKVISAQVVSSKAH